VAAPSQGAYALGAFDTGIAGFESRLQHYLLVVYLISLSVTHTM
jgi:hypothetical protein